MQDWGISRNRYWGTPLNIWECDECHHRISIGSREELKSKAIEKIDENVDKIVDTEKINVKSSQRTIKNV